MATNLNVPTNGLPLSRDVFTMFLALYTFLVCEFEKEKRVGKGCMVFYNPLCLEESRGPISLLSTGILNKKLLTISSLTFCYFVIAL